MADIREELDNALISEWEHHPVTSRYAEKVQQEIKNTELIFLAACRQSTDPAVRGGIGKLDQLHKMLDLFTPQKREEQE